MHFFQAPIQRFVHPHTAYTTTYASPLDLAGAAHSTGNLTLPHSTLEAGRSCTLFFDTPNWPSSAFKIAVYTSPHGNNTNPLVMAPNVYLTDADQYQFIRGNSVYANAATATNGIHVMYSATITDVKPLANRGDAANDYIVRPGDTFSITRDQANSNLVSIAGLSLPKITACRLRAKNTAIEFSAPIDPNLLDADVNAPTYYTGWAKNDIYFHDRIVGNGIENVESISRVSKSYKVVSANNWEGTLRNTVNLSYVSNNRAGIIPAPDPNLFTLSSVDAFKQNGILKKSSTVDLYTEFTQDLDISQGVNPFKCISFFDHTTNDNAGWMLSVQIYPTY